MNYILMGPEEGLKADWLQNEKKRVLSEHPDAEIHTLFVGDDKGEDLDAALSQPSLFSSFRFVILKQYENRTPRDTFDNALIQFLNSGQTDAEFIILSTEKSKAKLNKEIIKDENLVTVQFFWEMFDNQKRDWIRNAFQREGYRIGNDAVEEILFSVDNNTAEMKNLVTAISMYFHQADKEKTSITVEDIEKYSLQTRGEDGGTLFQAIADGDLSRSLSILSSIISSDSQAAQKAYSVLVTRFRTLESFEMLRAKGMMEKEAFDNADSLQPYTSFYPTKGIKGREQNTMRKAAARYPLKDTQRIIRYLSEMDSKAKNTSTEWTGIVFQSIIADIILRKGKTTGIDLDSSPLEWKL